MLNVAGILFQLDANTFKTVVAPSKRDGKALIKTLRSIELLQPLTVSQLEQLFQIMRPVSHLQLFRIAGAITSQCSLPKR